MIKQKILQTKYYKVGAQPSLAILSGTHGDEYEIIPIVSELLKEYKQVLPDFLHIPEVSPSAVHAKSRKNKWGRDVNRHFKLGTKDEEALATMTILKKHPIRFCVSFHEDPDLAEKFYMYDSKKMQEDRLRKFRSKLTEQEVRLFSGIDDPELQLEISDGYWHLDQEPDKNAGNLIDWAIAHQIIDRVIEVEIPGKANRAYKKKLANSFFEHIVIPLSSKN